MAESYREQLVRAKKERQSQPSGDSWKPRNSQKKPRRAFRIEYRIRPDLASKLSFFGHREWARFWTRYATKKDRAQALEALNRKDRVFEYRLPLAD